MEELIGLIKDRIGIKPLELTPSEQVARTLRKNTRFDWFVPPVTLWGGLEREEIMQIVVDVGRIIGFEKEEAKLIHLQFADEVEFDNKEPLVAAHHYMRYKTGKYTKFEIILNRSRRMADRYINTGKQSKKENEEPACVFEAPWEFIAWAVTEELSHAHERFITNTIYETKKIEGKFAAEMRATGLKDLEKHSYSFNYIEMKAQTTALNVLAMLSRKRAPEREQYFNNLQKTQQENHRSLILDISRIKERTFVNTDPKI